MKSFGNCLQIARKKAGITQKDLAALLNTPPQIISRYENSEHEPRISFAVNVAEVLNISLDELLQHNLSEKDYCVEVVRETVAEVYVKAVSHDEAIKLAKQKADNGTIVWKDFGTYSYEACEVRE